MNHNHPAKIIVIGSGIGGLSIAIILSRLGFEVTVIEKNRHPGGMMRSYTRAGLECEVGVHYLGALAQGQVLRRLWDWLQVSDQIPVVKIGAGGIVDRYVFDDFTFDFPQGFQAYQHCLIRMFPEEVAAIKVIMSRLYRASDNLNSLSFLSNTGFSEFLLDEFRPLDDILTELNCSAGLRGVLRVPTGWIGVPIHECPAFYYNMMLGSYLMSSWRLACSGKDMAQAFVDRFESLGGKLITGDGVTAILSEHKAVKGVRLESGMEIQTDRIAAAIHPAIALAMTTPGAVRKSYYQRIMNLNNTDSFVCLNATLNAKAHPAVDHNTFRIYADKEGGIGDSLFFQFRPTNDHNRTMMTILTGSTPDQWRLWEKTRSGDRHESYVHKKQKIALALLNSAEQIFGSMESASILDVFTPLTIRDWVSSPDGSAYGIKRSVKQMTSAALLNKFPLNGFWFTGQNILCPGILGTIIGSFLTTRSIIGFDRFQREINI